MQTARGRTEFASSDGESASDSVYLSSEEETIPLTIMITEMDKLKRVIKALRGLLKKARAKSPDNTELLAGPSPQKQVLLDLIASIDPNKKLDGQLADMLEARATFDKGRAAKLVIFFKQAADCEGGMLQRIASASEQFKNEWDAEWAGCVDARSKVLAYQQRVQEIKRDYKWIEDDIAGVERWMREAKELIDSLVGLDGELTSACQQFEADLPFGLSRVNERLDVSTDLSSHQRVLREASDLLTRVQQELASLCVDEKSVRVRHADMKRQSDAYATARPSYEALKSSIEDDITVSVRRVSKAVPECLDGFNKLEHSNEQEILGLLARSLDRLAPENVDEQLVGLLAVRGVDAQQYQSQIDNLQDQIKQLQREVSEVEKGLSELDKLLPEKAPTKEAFALGFFKAWRQAQFIEGLNNSLGMKMVQSSREVLTKQSEAWKEKELTLSGLKKRLEKEVATSHQAIHSLLMFMLSDKQACSLEDCERYFRESKVEIDRRLQALLKSMERFAQVNQAILDKKTVFDEMISFDRDDRLRKTVRSNLDYLLNNRIDQRAVDRLRSFEDKWRQFARYEGYVRRLLLNILPVTRSSFDRALLDVGHALNVPSLVKPEDIQRLTGAGEIYDSIVALYTEFFNQRRKVKEVVRRVAPEFRSRDESKGNAVPKLYDRIVSHIAGDLSAKVDGPFFKATHAEANRFAEEYATKSGGGQLICSEEEWKALCEIPRVLLASLDRLEKLGQELSDGGLISAIDAKKYLIDETLPVQAKHKLLLEALSHNIEFFLGRYGEYKTQRLNLETLVREVDVALDEVRSRIQLVETLRKLDMDCLKMIEAIQENVGAINGLRSNIFSTLSNLQGTVDRLSRDLCDAQAKIESEELFKKQVGALSRRITELRQREGQIRPEGGELFNRLKHEFLYSGKSRGIINQLKAHRQQHLVGLPKGDLVDEFLQNLFDKKRNDNLQDLLAYLEKPFGDNEDNNRTLFATRSFNFGRDSTTKRFINELREEWKKLVERERQAQPGSIAYAIKKDCDEIRGEYASFIKEKNLKSGSRRLVEAASFEELTRRIVAMPQQDPVADKIRGDLAELSRWSAGAKRASLACRLARMECAVAIRQNDVTHMQKLFDQYKFSYTYQSLKCHLESVTTNRKEDLAFLWRHLDHIAFGPGDEQAKYDTLRKVMLRYFNHLRQEDAHSFTGFFGRVSRLTRATEAFLLVDKANRGLGYELGEGEDKVHHVAETRLFALSCLRAQ